jgi:hypothetical protein
VRVEQIDAADKEMVKIQEAVMNRRGENFYPGGGKTKGEFLGD